METEKRSHGRHVEAGHLSAIAHHVLEDLCRSWRWIDSEAAQPMALVPVEREDERGASPQDDPGRCGCLARWEDEGGRVG